MKYCRSCGAELLDEAVVCPKCGVAVDEIKPLKKNNFAIAGFVLSLVSLFVTLYTVPAILGLVFSIIGLAQIKKGGYKNKKLAVAGIVLAAIALVWDVLYYAVYEPILLPWLEGLL